MNILISEHLTLKLLTLLIYNCIEDVEWIWTFKLMKDVRPENMSFETSIQ